jgi:hypothetical protein
MSFIPPPQRQSFLQVNAENERVKEAQVRTSRHWKQKDYDEDHESGKDAPHQGLLQRLTGFLRGQR